MKAVIRDPAILTAVRPLDLASYLRASGWREVKHAPAWAEWTYAVNGQEYEALLPLDPAFRDYPGRIAEVLRALEAVEGRSQLEILRDLSCTGSDVIRLRVEGNGASDGSIPLEQGARLVEKARDLLTAAACAAVEPRAAFATRKPVQAVDYVRRVRLGQTEQGSYVVTLLSRVPPTLFPDLTEDPFERKVTSTLARSLAAAHAAAERTAAAGGFDAFGAAVPEGVSANLCEALAGMGAEEGNRGVEVGITWSPTRPVTGAPAVRVKFSPDALPIIAEAGRVFRATHPVEEFEVRGIVFRLERPEGALLGRVTILDVSGDKSRKVNVDLMGQDYDLAIRAHQERIPVGCVGELQREGPRFTLRNPRDFRVLAEE